MKFIVAQLGARMHYAVPSILARADMLERLYTDTYAPRAVRLALSTASWVGPRSLRRWLGRAPVDIPENLITAFNGMGLEYFRRRRSSASSRSKTAAHLWVGSEFCRRIVDRGLGNASAVYTFNSAGLELLQFARSRGVFAVMEQTIAPRVIEGRLIDREEADYPQWALPCCADPLQRAYSEREQSEWKAADLILCGSEFVRESIGVAGGPVNCCCVVPYGVCLPASVPTRDFCHKPLRVLTVGAVGLRKGSPYVLAAARAHKGNAEFRMVGPLDITPHAQKSLSILVNLLGAVPRSEIQRHFAWADVFLLPSICEGSATACYEALAYGLPVIATPNTGSVVRDGLDGYIVPIRDSEAITDRIERLAANRDLLAAMSQSALKRASEYTLEKYGERLLSQLRFVHSP